MDKRLKIIKDRLESEIKTISLSIEDQGHMHKGHKAHIEGKMHIWIEIVSDDFIDMNPIQRHQLEREELYQGQSSEWVIAWFPHRSTLL